MNEWINQLMNQWAKKQISLIDWCMMAYLSKNGKNVNDFCHYKSLSISVKLRLVDWQTNQLILSRYMDMFMNNTVSEISREKIVLPGRFSKYERLPTVTPRQKGVTPKHYCTNTITKTYLTTKWFSRSSIDENWIIFFRIKCFIWKLI